MDSAHWTHVRACAPPRAFQEFLDLMCPLSEPMMAEEFGMHTRAMLEGERPDEALNEPGYKHRHGAWLYGYM